ncbi:MAG: hypothetical protein R3B90_00680 [Planctomycetaceae bacterium]
MDFYKEWLGIPEGPRPPDHYELLRVRRFEDDVDKIRAHYKKLNAHVRKYATGQYSVQSQELLNEMAKAMLCLTDRDRKRDYDEGLGREFEVERDSFGRMPLLEVLVAQGELSRDQSREVEEFAERRGLSHRDAVVQMKLVPPDKAARALAQQLGFSFVDLEDMAPEDDALDRVPRGLVKKHSFVPLFVDDDRLLIACSDEIEHELEDELRLRFGFAVRPVIATPRSINQAIAQYYAPGMRDEEKIAAAETSKSTGGKATATRTATKANPKQAAAVDQETGGFGKALLYAWIALLMSPVLLQLVRQFSATVNMWFIIYPMISWVCILVPLVGGGLTFAYFKFLKK